MEPWNQQNYPWVWYFQIWSFSQKVCNNCRIKRKRFNSQLTSKLPFDQNTMQSAKEEFDLRIEATAKKTFRTENVQDWRQLWRKNWSWKGKIAKGTADPGVDYINSITNFRHTITQSGEYFQQQKKGQEIHVTTWRDPLYNFDKRGGWGDREDRGR